MPPTPTPTENPVPVDPNPTVIRYYRGVRERPRGRYDAEIRDPVKKTPIRLGTFINAVDAARASTRSVPRRGACIDAMAREIRGSWARTNFPSPPKLRRAAATVSRIPSQSSIVGSSSPPLGLSLAAARSGGPQPTFFPVTTRPLLVFEAILEWVFVLTNLMLETLSTVFDQISSPERPRFALVGMAMSLVAFLICTLELLYRARKERAVWRQCWFYDQSDKPLGSFADNFGFICAVSQCLSSTMQYVFLESHADNPIKVSFFPVMLALSFLYLQFTKRKQLQLQA